MNAIVKLTDETMSKLALSGDVSGLNAREKVQYYAALCQRVGLDPTTQPFKLMRLNGKEIFYLDRGGAQQLNRIHQISHAITSREYVNGCYVVTARASIGDRFTDSIGSVPTDGLKGEAFSNATMKAETKAKRRATLDLVGLGMLDELEVATIPNAQPADSITITPKLTPQPAKDTERTDMLTYDIHQGAETIRQSSKTPSPVSKPATPPETPEDRRKRFLDLFRPYGAAAEEIFADHGLILAGETIDCIEDSKIEPLRKSNVDALLAEVKALWGDAPLPNLEFPPPSNPTLTQPEQFRVNPKADEPWRELRTPFKVKATPAGTKLDNLEKGQLWWWVMCFAPKNWNDKSGKLHYPRKEEVEFFDTLAKHKPAIIARYDFTPPKD